MARMFHVTSPLNRESIRVHGLDSARMGAAPGIAGSPRPETDGVFLCTTMFDAEFFIRFSGDPVDVWAVDGVDPGELLPNDSWFHYYPGTVPPDRVELARADVRNERTRGGSA